MARKKKRVGGRFGAFISVISTTLVLILLGADVFFVTVASNFSKNLRENFAVEVLLEDNIPQHDLYLLQEDLKRYLYLLQPLLQQVYHLHQILEFRHLHK